MLHVNSFLQTWLWLSLTYFKTNGRIKSDRGDSAVVANRQELSWQKWDIAGMFSSKSALTVTSEKNASHAKINNIRHNLMMSQIKYTGLWKENIAQNSETKREYIF